MLRSTIWSLISFLFRPDVQYRPTDSETLIIINTQLYSPSDGQWLEDHINTFVRWQHTAVERWASFAVTDTAYLISCIQNSFALDVQNGDISDQASLSVNVLGPTSRLPVIMTWHNVSRCQCEFVPVEPGRHSVWTVIIFLYRFLRDQMTVCSI